MSILSKIRAFLFPMSVEDKRILIDVIEMEQRKRRISEIAKALSHSCSIKDDEISIATIDALYGYDEEFTRHCDIEWAKYMIHGNK